MSSEEELAAGLDADELTARDSVEYLLDGAQIPGLDWYAMPEWARLHLSRWLPERVLREVTAKRAIIAEMKTGRGWSPDYYEGLRFAVNALAGVYG